MRITPSDWIDLLHRIEALNLIAHLHGRYIVVDYDKSHYAVITDHSGQLKVNLYRRTKIGSDHLVESFSGLRGLNAAATAVRRAKLTVEESA